MYINHKKNPYLFTPRNRPRHPPHDAHLPAQALQPRQRAPAPAALDAADVVLGQGAHVDGPLAPVGFAAGPPVLRQGEAVEVVEGGGARVWREDGGEGGEVGLFGHSFYSCFWVLRGGWWVGGWLGGWYEGSK